MMYVLDGNGVPRLRKVRYSNADRNITAWAESDRCCRAFSIGHHHHQSVGRVAVTAQ